MKKKILSRILYGIPLGITVGYIITIVISLLFANGYYNPCVPELIADAGSEINAVILQTLLCALLGAGSGALSVIWEIDHWSFLKQTIIHFILITVLMMPIAYYARWMERSLKGFLQYFGIFIGIFLIIWIILYFRTKHHVKQMNNTLHKTN